MGLRGWLEPEEEAVFRAYARSARRLFAAIDRDLQREANLSRTVLEVLWLLSRQDEDAPLRMGQIADRLALPKSRVTQAVDALAADGRVARRASAADARVAHALVTPEGRAVLRRAAACYAASIRAHLLAPLDAEQRDRLAEIGTTLLAALDPAAAESVPGGAPAAGGAAAGAGAEAGGSETQR